MARPKHSPNSFRSFNSSPEVIRFVVMIYQRYALSLRNVEDLLAERGSDVSYSPARFWWNPLGPTFAAEIRRRRVAGIRAHAHWRRHLDEAYVKIGGEKHYLWRAVGSRGRGAGILRHEGARQGRGADFHEEADETPRLSQGDHHRRSVVAQQPQRRRSTMTSAG
jgi:hypothetical protein